jgi:hypothetical protein
MELLQDEEAVNFTLQNNDWEDNWVTQVPRNNESDAEVGDDELIITDSSIDDIFLSQLSEQIELDWEDQWLSQVCSHIEEEALCASDLGISVEELQMAINNAIDCTDFAIDGGPSLLMANRPLTSRVGKQTKINLFTFFILMLTFILSKISTLHFKGLGIVPGVYVYW